MASVSKLSGQVTRAGRGAISFVAGKVNAVVNRSRGPNPEMDDNTIKDKVETELFRGAEIPKGQINVHVVDGIVELRGEVKNPETKKALAEKAESIPEVRDVNNLLHLPKTPPVEPKANALR